MPKKRLFWPWLILSILVFSCSAKIPNVRVYAAAGKLSNGGIWADTNDKETGSITFAQMLAFLEASKDHGAALCMSPDDYGKIKVAIEEMCQSLGSACKVDTIPIVARIDALVSKTAN